MNPRFVESDKAFQAFVKENGRKSLNVVDTSKMTKEEVEASSGSYLLWSTNGSVDCSVCQRNETPCDGCLFFLPRMTRAQLLQRCGRVASCHFMGSKPHYCLLCKVENPQSPNCDDNIWGNDGELSTYKDGLITLECAAEDRMRQMIAAGAASAEITELYERRWTELTTPKEADAENSEERNVTFPEITSGGELFNDVSDSPMIRTHQLNAEMSECLICGTRSIENQMCYGPEAVSVSAPEYIDISSCSATPEQPSAAEECEAVKVSGEREIIDVEMEEAAKLKCWCKYEVTVFLAIYDFKFKIILTFRTLRRSVRCDTLTAQVPRPEVWPHHPMAGYKEEMCLSLCHPFHAVTNVSCGSSIFVSLGSEMRLIPSLEMRWWVAGRVMVT